MACSHPISARGIRTGSGRLIPALAVALLAALCLAVAPVRSEEPSLLTALESYERRGDWGLIYPIKIELDGRL